MNAPFNPRGSAVREPFAAFVIDESTADLLKPVVAEFGWPQERISKGGLRNAVQSLSVSASPHILFVDLSESGDPLNDINSLAEVCEPGTVVIAAGQVNDVRLYRDLVSSGIQDYLLKPFTADQMRDALAQAQMTISGPRVPDGGGTDRPHLMTAFIGVRGGIGASSLATSVAWLFGDRDKRSTALLDLDVHFGTGALALDLEPGRGLIDAIDNPSRIDGLFLERALVSHNERLAVLSAEAPISSPMMNDGTAFSQLQEELKNAFECTVIDLPRSQIVLHPHLLHDAQAVVVVTEFTLAGDARHDPHPLLAEIHRPAGARRRRREQGADGRDRDQPQGFRNLDRAKGGRADRARHQARDAGREARQAVRGGREDGQDRPVHRRDRRARDRIGGGRRRAQGQGRAEIAAGQAWRHARQDAEQEEGRLSQPRREGGRTSR